MIRHIATLFGLWLVTTASLCGGEPLKVSVNAESAILLNADTKTILFDKDAQKVMFPASTTKAAAALYMLNRGGTSLDTMVTVESEAIASISEAAKKRANFSQPAYWLELDGGHIGLKKGEQMTLRDLLYAMMLPSANDAANVVAMYVGGTIPKFMEGMNAYLKEIGCKNTNLLNPHGLHHPEHVSTAYDLALVGCEALKNPILSEVMSTIRYTRPKTNMQEPSVMTQTNLLMRKGSSYYSKAIGLKTGYHWRAQHNLIAAARQGDRTLVAVLLYNEDRKEMFKDAVKLFEAAFNQPQIERTVLQGGPQPFSLRLKGSSRAIETFMPQPVKVLYYPAEEPQIKALLYWDDVKLPVVKGQRVGEVRVTTETGRVLTTAPLYAVDEVHPSLWFRMVRALGSISIYLWIALALFLAALGFFLKKVR